MRLPKRLLIADCHVLILLGATGLVTPPVLYGENRSSTALEQYGIRDAQATPVLVYADQVVAGTPVTYQTQILTRGGDTVIHVLEDAPQFRQIAASDDCKRGGHGQGGNDSDDDDEGTKNKKKDKDKGSAGSFTKRRLASCLTVTLTATTRVRVLVRAAGNGSVGRANLLRNGVQVVANFPFAGTQVRMSWVPSDVFETPLASPTRFPGASTDTQLLLVRNPPLGLVAYDDDSGVGLASRLTALIVSNGHPLTSGNSSYVVVASTSASTEGPARLVQNDVFHADTDSDGLGNALELATDPAGFLPTSPGVEDTDGDGISDGWELLGRDGTHPQLLSRWGASPRHKDLFIEIDRDRSAGAAGITLSAKHAQALAAQFALWPNSELFNPDGQAGVAVHIDNGVASSGDVSGNFGGSEDVADSGDLLQAYAQHFVAERRGVFKYALAKSSCEEIAHVFGDHVVFASTCGEFAWKNLAHNVARNLSWGESCCDFRRF